MSATKLRKFDLDFTKGLKWAGLCSRNKKWDLFKSSGCLANTQFLHSDQLSPEMTQYFPCRANRTFSMLDMKNIVAFADKNWMWLDADSMQNMTNVLICFRCQLHL